MQEWIKKVSRRTLQAMEPTPFGYGRELAPDASGEGVFFAQIRSFEHIHSAAPDQAPAAPASAPHTQPASPVANAPVPATAVSPAETEAFSAPSSAAPQDAAETAAGTGGNDMVGSTPCDGLEGDPAEWMRSLGAMGFACAQQVSHPSTAQFPGVQHHLWQSCCSPFSASSLPT